MDRTVPSQTNRIVSVSDRLKAVRLDRLPALIQEIHQVISKIGKAPPEPTKLEPVVEVEKSVFADHLVCLACGKPFTLLKGHLMAAHQLTAEQYRSRFGLQRGYPFVAPNYSNRRSAMAKKIGLGSGGHADAGKRAGRKRG